MYAKCNTVSNKCECVAVSNNTRGMEKVCGTDGITYENAAVLKYDSCMNNTQTVIKGSGKCSQGM